MRGTGDLSRLEGDVGGFKLLFCVDRKSEYCWSSHRSRRCLMERNNHTKAVIGSSNGMIYTWIPNVACLVLLISLGSHGSLQANNCSCFAWERDSLEEMLHDTYMILTLSHF